MKIELAQIYSRDYLRISGAKIEPGSLILDINEAEELWQELMVKCQEYRQTVIEEVEQ